MRRPLKSLLAAKIVGGLLGSPLSQLVERWLVWLAHRYPYSLPGQGTIVGQLVSRKVDEDLVADLMGGGKISVPLTPQGISFYLVGCLTDEKELTNFLRRVLREGDVFFDIGANLGFYTFLAAGLCGYSGRVYSFEPQASLVNHLLRSVALNSYEDRISIMHAAVGENHGGEVKLFLSKNSQNNTGAASIFPHEWLDRETALSVPSISLDGYVRDKRISRIDVMKIDIEGGEMLALRGMEETLKRMSVSVIILELFPTVQLTQYAGHPQAHADAAKPLEVVNFLRDLGYELHQIQSEGRLGKSYTDEAICSLPGTINVAFTLPILKKSRPEIFGL
jgi:FkbM family methyltransferase